jgi:Spy/CpxP family protein refolding chaperone
MNPSSKRPLIFFIIFLLLTNIAVLGYFLWYKPGPGKVPAKQGGPKENGIASELRKEVGFNDQQVAEYKKIREEQWKKFGPMLQDVRKAKDSLYKLLGSESANDSVINNVASLIGERQKALDLQAFNHFRRLRTICTPEQLPKYDSMIQRMMRKMGKPQKNKDKK